MNARGFEMPAILIMGIGDGFFSITWENMLAFGTQKSREVAADVGIMHVPSHIFSSVALVLCGVAVSLFGFGAGFALSGALILAYFILVSRVLWLMEKKLTDFEKKVLAECAKIPRGETKSYKQVAVAIGKPNAYRAVANALAKNPFPVKIPCHRVIRSDGEVGGYSGKGGIKRKRELLKGEGVKI